MDLVSESWNQLHSWVFEASEGIRELGVSNKSYINEACVTI